MGKYTIFYLFENPRRGMQARNFTTNVPKILDLKSSSEQIFSRKLSLGAPDQSLKVVRERKSSVILRHSAATLSLYPGFILTTLGRTAV